MNKVINVVTLALKIENTFLLHTNEKRRRIMPVLTYRRPGLTIRRGGSEASDQQIRDLQRDLRQLGYLRKGIDGK
jgi:hypothetical protein